MKGYSHAKHKGIRKATVMNAGIKPWDVTERNMMLKSRSSIHHKAVVPVTTLRNDRRGSQLQPVWRHRDAWEISQSLD